MKKVRKYLWLKSAGLLSVLIVFLLGTTNCRGRRHMTKYGPPSDYGYDEPVTKYGPPSDYGIDELDETNDSTAISPDEFDYEHTITKYGVPVDYDEIEGIIIDTTDNNQ